MNAQHKMERRYYLSHASFLSLFRFRLGYGIPRLHIVCASGLWCAHQSTGIRFLAGIVVPFDCGLRQPFQAACGRKTGADRGSGDVEFLRPGDCESGSIEARPSLFGFYFRR